MVTLEFRQSFITLTRIGILIFVLSVPLLSQGKNPVIFIPGLSGSELKHKQTGEKIWFNPFKSKSEDLRLAANAKIQDYIIGVLDNSKVKDVTGNGTVH